MCALRESGDDTTVAAFTDSLHSVAGAAAVGTLAIALLAVAALRRTTLPTDASGVAAGERR